VALKRDLLIDCFPSSNLWAKNRHLDRSRSQSHHERRSGETPAFRFFLPSPRHIPRSISVLSPAQCLPQT
jgi:hypothetical protein